MARRPRKPPRPGAQPPECTTAADVILVATSDLNGFLFSLASRLRVLAWTLRGLAADEPTARDPDDDPGRAVADEMERTARAIRGTAEHLCSSCRTRDITESVRIAIEPAGKRG